MSEKIKFNRKEYNKRYYELHKEDILKKRKIERYNAEMNKTFYCKYCSKSYSRDYCSLSFIEDLKCLSCFRLDMDNKYKKMLAAWLIELTKKKNNEIKKI